MRLRPRGTFEATAQVWLACCIHSSAPSKNLVAVGSENELEGGELESTGMELRIQAQRIEDVM